MTTPLPREGDEVVSLLSDAFGEALQGAFLHGSAVAGGLRPDSDLDLIAVVDGPVKPGIRLHLREKLLRISGRHRAGDGTRPIELAIFDRNSLHAGTFPARVEFIYGEWLRSSYEAAEIPPPHADPEYTLMLAQARDQAISLHGPALWSLVPRIGTADIRRAIGDALPALLASLQSDDLNVLLTLSRMAFTMETGTFAGKDAAATWAAAKMSPGGSATMTKARDAYLAGASSWKPSPQAIALAARELQQMVKSRR